jgi:hypothetical protein
MLSLPIASFNFWLIFIKARYSNSFIVILVIPEKTKYWDLSEFHKTFHLTFDKSRDEIEVFDELFLIVYLKRFEFLQILFL